MNIPADVGMQIERLVSELSPEVRSLLDGLPGAQSCSTPAELARRVRVYQARLETAAETEPLLDIGRGRKVAALCLEMLRGLGEHPQTARLQLAQAAVAYFAREDDAVPDTGSVIGFDDDLAVVQAVATVLRSP